MKKHTPGPWTLLSIQKTANSREFMIKRGKFSTRLTHEKDAHLMAAAPEMFRECTFALEMLHALAKSNPNILADPGYHNFKFRLEEVLKKAKGE